MTSSLGVEVSLARRGIIFLLHSSGKDQELVQVGEMDQLMSRHSNVLVRYATKMSRLSDVLIG